MRVWLNGPSLGRKIDRSALRQSAKLILSALGFLDEELSITLTSDDGIAELAGRYGRPRRPTDVLAFAAMEVTGADIFPFVSPPDGVLHLGEVIISYPQAVVQAAEHQHSMQREVALLIIHGVLHLLGYEHDSPQREEKMRAKEADILGSIGGGLK